MPNQPAKLARSPWPHRWAWALACATFPLVWWGAFVTTTDAGMAFRDWLTSDGHFMLVYPWLSSAGDKFVEHGHRLLAVVVGILTIGLAATAYRCESRQWVKRFSLALLAGVILQGVLGGLRVVLDARTMALIHGCTGPLFFALCTAMVVFPSPWWERNAPAAGKSSVGNPSAAKPAVPASGLLRLAVLCCTLAYLQLVVGAVVRHTPQMTAAGAGTIFQVAIYFHVVLALLIFGHVGLLALRSWRQTGIRALSTTLCLLVGVQILLGVATWLMKYGTPEWFARRWGALNYVIIDSGTTQAVVITSHVAVGSLIVAVSLAAALRVARLSQLRLPGWSTAVANAKQRECRR